MAVVQIFELDSSAGPVSVLDTGEYSFGRGPLLKCTDRRVSRKHGIITITNETATITSTHQNPCFYQAADSSTITILPKNDPVHLKDGDKFSLLADQFWFRIKIARNESSESHKTNGNSSSRVENLSSKDGENGRLSPLSFTSAPVSSDFQDDSDFHQITQVGQETKLPESNEHFNQDSDSINSDATQKRVHAADIESSSNKKTKFNNEIEDDENELLSVLGDLQENKALDKSEVQESEKNVAKFEGQNGKEVLSDIEEEDSNKKTISSGKDKKEMMSDSDDDNIVVKIKPDTPKKNRYKWKKEAAPVSLAQSAQGDAYLMSILDSSDEDNENQPSDLKQESKTSASSKNCNVNKDIKLNVNNDSTAINEDSKKKDSKDSDSNKKKDAKDNDDSEKDDKTNEDPNAAGTSGSKQKKNQRDHCWYGLGCYRKNAAHLAEYSHPGDSDFDADPEDDRPVCAFGGACYRRNKDHRQAYKHPNMPQKPPGGAKRPKKQTKNQDAPKKRTARKQYNESSDDDYDLQDPFLDDSGTEYEATSSDESDSESEWSGASDGETKRLLKEAKKFTRGKKKDKKDDD